MRAELLHDDDDALLTELRRPHSVEEAWESLRYWERRRERLGPLQRRAGREAEYMIDVWAERVKAAERAEYGPPAWEPLVHALRLDHLPLWHRRTRKRLKRAAIRTAVAGTAVTATFAGGAAVVIAHVLG